MNKKEVFQTAFGIIGIDRQRELNTNHESWRSLWRQSGGEYEKAVNIIRTMILHSVTFNDRSVWFDTTLFNMDFDWFIAETFNGGIEVEWVC